MILMTQYLRVLETIAISVVEMSKIVILVTEILLVNFVFKTLMLVLLGLVEFDLIV